jgi:hypothetical protein
MGDPNTLRGEDPSEEPDPEGDPLEKAAELVTAGGGGFIRVYKEITYKNGGKGYAQAGKYDVSAFDPQEIVDKYGPGRYRFYFYNADGKKVSARVENFAEPVSSAAPADPFGASGSILQLLFAQMARSEQRSHELMIAMIQAQGGHGSSGSDGTGILEAVRLGKEIAAASAPPPLGAQAADLFKAALEMRKSADGDTDPLMALAPKLLDVIAAGLNRPAALPAPAGPAPGPPAVSRRAAGPPRPAPAPPAPNPAPYTQAEPGQGAAAALAGYAPAILEEVRAGRDPRVWGQFIAERIPPAYQQQLVDLALLDDEDRTAAVEKAAPALAQCRPWLAEAFEGILDVLDTEEGDDSPADDEEHEDENARGSGVRPDVDSEGGARDTA